MNGPFPINNRLFLSSLISLLHNCVPFHANSLDCFSSYLSNRTEYVSLGSATVRMSPRHLWISPMFCPRSSLFIIYMLPLGHAISQHGISCHCYSDDTQLYLRKKRAWVNHNFLQLNSSKMEASSSALPIRSKQSARWFRLPRLIDLKIQMSLNFIFFQICRSYIDRCVFVGADNMQHCGRTNSRW